MDLGALLKQQSLTVLMDALGKPAAGAGIGTSGQTTTTAPALNLMAGETITARVTAVKPGGALLLAINGQPVQAEVKGNTLPSAARQPGAEISLKVETTGTTPRLTFVTAEAAPAVQQQTQPATQARTSATPAPSAQVETKASAVLATVRIVTGPEPTTQRPPTVATPASPLTPKAEAVARAATEAATRQGSAAPLYADLAALASRNDTALPRPVAAIANALLTLRLDGEKPVTPEGLKQALTASGVLQEANLAKGAPAPLDAKALLTTLRDLLRTDADRFIPPDAEPPRRDGSVTALKAALPLLASEQDPKTIAATLGKEAEQAVERVKLHQIASLPEQRPGTTEQQRPQQLSFEIPVAFGQQTAMAGFRIEREKRQARRDTAEGTDIWGVRFAIDADVLGPVHAHVRLSGSTVSVSLWAEEHMTHAAFAASIPLLESALRENALDIGDVQLFKGKPAEPRRAISGHFLDRRS